MERFIKPISQNKKAQMVLFGLYVVLTSAGLYFADKSVTAFLLLLGSILILYLLNLGNKTKWIIGIIILSGLLPFVASNGSSYQSYMEVATLVGIYVAMALGLNIVVGFAGLLDLGFVAFFA